VRGARRVAETRGAAVSVPWSSARTTTTGCCTSSARSVRGSRGKAGEQVRELIEERDDSPFAAPLAARDARFVVPHLVGTVRHRGLTGEGKLRQPVWLGLRDDIDPDAVRLDGPSTRDAGA
jgi:ATP-dependent DNA ligase